MSRNNKEIVSEINEESKPEMGTRVAAGKDGRGETDALTSENKKVAVTDAKDVPGAAKKAIDAQCGKSYDNMPHVTGEDMIHNKNSGE